MSKRPECATEGCPLTPVKYVFPDLEGVDPNRCYRCAPAEVRAEQRRLRAEAHARWLKGGAVEAARESLAKNLARDLGLED